MKIFSVIKNLVLCVLSASLLILCFPKSDISLLAWVALVPLFLALDGKNKTRSFFIGYIFGIVFFTGTLYWFVYVHVAAFAAVVVYLSFYTGLFGIFYSVFLKRSLMRRLFILPCVWVALDLAKDYIFTGFGWVSLGLTQYKNLAFIQIADIAGVYGVTFVVVLLNLFFKEIFVSFFCFILRQRSEKPRSGMVNDANVIGPLILVSVVLFVVFSYGDLRLKDVEGKYKRDMNKKSGYIKVAVIQANIPQDLKWHEPAWIGILDRYFDLTKKAAEKRPDLIIWPETALPGVIGEDDRFFGEIMAFVDSIDIPVLLGAVIREDDNYYNSAVLIGADGKIKGVYNKIHLVPFGEYVPFRSFFPAIADLVPIADFTPGEEYVNFLVPGDKQGRYSVLICFEDTIARLARKFVQNGAGLFINITNDAWFMDTKAPYLHLQASVLRAVENRRGLIRCANTGVSSFIEPSGRIIKYLRGDSLKETFVSGYIAQGVTVEDGKTVYSLFGDVFAYLCVFYLFLELFLLYRP